MNRFRKKSESRRQYNPEIEGVRTTTTVHDDASPSLPPASDFRTSLILPGLSRRFTLLRSYNGDPAALEDLRIKFAEQRARGALNQVSQEEEGMILEALGLSRMRFSDSGHDDNSLPSNPTSPRESSTHSIDTVTSGTGSFLSSSPSKSSKRYSPGRRYSNNLFGSGRFRDYSYVRSVQRGSNRSALSATPSEASISTKNASHDLDGFLRPTTPDRVSSFALSAQSSPNGCDSTTPLVRSAALDPPSPYASDANSSVGTEFRLSNALSSEAFNRASRALEDVIREIEEEAEEPGVDDDIVLLRSSPTPADHIQHETAPIDSLDEEVSSRDEARSPLSDYETGTALSSDDHIPAGDSRRASAMSLGVGPPYSSSRTTSPTPRLPGYIPGMQRPMTPRDVGLESDDQSSSATPRATPPRLPGMTGPVIIPVSSAIGRRDSNASTAKQPSRTNTPLASTGSATPLFFSRTVNGRFTPEDRQNGEAVESDRDRHSSRRKPVSPLTLQAYQPINVASSSPVPSSSSRPGTPSSIATWNQSYNQSPCSRPSHARSGSGHSRNGSLNSLTDITSTDMHAYGVAVESTLARSKSSSTTNRSVRSPALPDSPLIDNGRMRNDGQVSQAKSSMDHNRSPSVISGMDLGSPFSFSKMINSMPTGNGVITSSPASRTKSPNFSENGRDRAMVANGSPASGNPKLSSKRHQKTDSASSMTGFTLSLGSSSLPLVLSPMMNSSRSSMESEGSSYHSWDEAGGRPKDRVKAMFAKIEAEPPDWCDLTADESLGIGSGSFGKEEDLVRQLSGLSKTEFANIQDKLIDLVTSKSYESGREKSDRAGSALRKRRPSTSQSNYSVGGGKDSRVASPSPAPTRSNSPSAAVALATPVVDQSQPNSLASKANALLDSVIDSIQSPKTPPISIPGNKTDATPTSLSRARTASEVSSPTRRNRNLADALFGPEDQSATPQPPLQLPAITPLSVPRSLTGDRSPQENMTSPHLPRSPGTAPTSAWTSMIQMSSPNLATAEENELTREVQRKVEAATIALRKSPSNPKLPDIGTVTKRKINRDQISSPTLVSATTSVDTIPLPSVSPISNSGSTSKFGQRIRKLRGTLKSKTNPILGGEGVTPFPLDLKSSTTNPNSQQSGSRADTSNMPSTARAMHAASATDLEKYKVQITPPASSGPGFKGFMARFRKNKNPDTLLDVPQRRDIQYSSSSTVSFSPSSPGGSTSQLHPTPSMKKSFQGKRPASMRSIKASPQEVQESQHQVTQSISVPNTPMESQEDDDYSQESHRDEAALKQLFDAASNLGLDQAALNNLVARSTSTSSRSTRWTGMTNNSLAPSRKSRPSDVLEDTEESIRPPSASDGRSSLEGFSSRVAGPVIKKLSIKKHSESSRRPQNEQEDVLQQKQTASSAQQRQQRPLPCEEKNTTASRNTIIRRTIILPSETKGMGIDINALLRKNTQPTTGTRKRRSASGASIHSNRSLQERAPTPPPPRSGGANGKRFSTDAHSPPVPHLPSSFSAHLDVPHGEKPSSTYDSLFDMYAGDSRVPSAVPGEAHSDVEGMPPSESGPALEVVEMANGETIWSIVNGLRDDDAESFYGNRASFASEYSLRETNSEGVQVYFKEHTRTSSKDSGNSFTPRKKPSGQINNNRPETKVFFSSSAQIGRLIENLSKGLDAGSFNILPNARPQSHATTPSMGSESDMRWTVEERLEHLLGSMGTHS